VSIYTEYRHSQSHTHLVNTVPVQDTRRIGEIPVLIHDSEVKLPSKHGQTQLHLQLGRLRSRTRVSAGFRTEGGVRAAFGSGSTAAAGRMVRGSNMGSGGHHLRTPYTRKSPRCLRDDGLSRVG